MWIIYRAYLGQEISCQKTEVRWQKKKQSRD